MAIVGCSVQRIAKWHNHTSTCIWMLITCVRCDRTVNPGQSWCRESQVDCRRSLTYLRGCGGGWIQINSPQRNNLWAVALLRD